MVVDVDLVDDVGTTTAVSAPAAATTTIIVAVAVVAAAAAAVGATTPTTTTSLSPANDHAIEQSWSTKTAHRYRSTTGRCRTAAIPAISTTVSATILLGSTINSSGNNWQRTLVRRRTAGNVLFSTQGAGSNGNTTQAEPTARAPTIQHRNSNDTPSNTATTPTPGAHHQDIINYALDTDTAPPLQFVSTTFAQPGATNAPPTANSTATPEHHINWLLDMTATLGDITRRPNWGAKQPTTIQTTTNDSKCA